MRISRGDLELALKAGFLVDDSNGGLSVGVNDYQGKIFKDVVDIAKTGKLFSFGGELYYWIFPKPILEAFDEIIVLTYMFDGQQLKYYFDLNAIEYSYIGVRKTSERFEFCENYKMEQRNTDFRNKIHILQNKKINRIGDDRFALSKSWYERRRKNPEDESLKQLKNNIRNVFSNIFKSKSDENMWTTFKNYHGLVRGAGYSRGLVACNTRATNQYVCKDSLAYAVNVFMHPNLTNWFHNNGISVDQDKYALSEMLQWIWRSGIREGREINLYVPSRRMRTLLENWIKENSPRSDEDPLSAPVDVHAETVNADSETKKKSKRESKKPAKEKKAPKKTMFRGKKIIRRVQPENVPSGAKL